MTTTTTATHTPGPWTTHEIEYDADHTTIEIHGSDGLFLSEITYPTDEVELLRANARLIVAAPDLLEACKLWLAHYDKCVREQCIGDEPGIREMRAAIAKATGNA